MPTTASLRTIRQLNAGGRDAYQRGFDEAPLLDTEGNIAKVPARIWPRSATDGLDERRTAFDPVGIT